MINDYSVEQMIKKYAVENKYTLIANTFGSLEYIKYIDRNINTLKWSKGSDSVIIAGKKIKIDNLIK